MKLLITRHDKIGDFITMLPVCKVLREQTDHTVVMLVSPVNADLARSLDFVDEVIAYTDDSKALIQTIRSYNFDVSISGYIDMTLGKVLFKSGIPIRISPATKMAQIFFNKRVKQRRSRVEKREFEYNLDLLKAFDPGLVLDFKRPLLTIPDVNHHECVIFHPGFGGSSDGNLSLDDYWKLAKKASERSDIVFTFGPDDQKTKAYFVSKTEDDNNRISIRDDFNTLLAFTKFIASSKLFVSTSTGPMHLAGLTNTKTLSFFGDTLFASAKRWGTISDEVCQNNFTVPLNYSQDLYIQIENRLLELINA
jgi:ADP-heptose:LPS heptosyltransferase